MLQRILSLTSKRSPHAHIHKPFYSSSTLPFTARRTQRWYQSTTQRNDADGLNSYPNNSNSNNYNSHFSTNSSSVVKKRLTVSLVGRPNTGKSTLFNRITHKKKAIVSNIPGTTRDRAEGQGYIAGIPLTIIDTGGLDNRGAFIQEVVHQVSRALVTSDAVLFLLDARTGVTATDRKFATWLRETIAQLAEERKVYLTAKQQPYVPTKVLLVANKTEGAFASDYVLDVISDSYSLGYGEPILISASHGDGMGDLGQHLLKMVQQLGYDDGSQESSSHKNKVSNSSANNNKRVARKLLLREAQELVEEEEENKVKKNKLTNNVHTMTDTEGDENLTVETEDDELTEAEKAVIAELELQALQSEDELDIDDSDKESIDTFMATTPDSATHTPKPAPPKVIELAIMGKPNVGKSTLLNAFIGENRVIAGPTPGLTRDSISVEWTFADRPFRLVDTAGLTRIRSNDSLLVSVKEEKHMSLVDSVGKNAANQRITLPGIQHVDIEEDPSQFSAQIAEYALLSALQTLKYANVVMLVVEASQGKFQNIDIQLARKCLEEGRGLFIAANKVDVLIAQGLSLTQYEKQVKEHTQELFREFGNIPVVACSGEEGRSLTRLLRTATKVHDAWNKRISTGTLNDWLREVQVTAPKARVGDKALKVKYMTQVKTRPPTFTLFCNTQELPSFYERYLRHKIQEDFQLEGVPVRLLVHKSEGNAVKMHLLKQGKHTRRGIGRGESKGKLGAHGKENTRTVDFYRRQKGRSEVEERRRRDTRLRKKRSV